MKCCAHQISAASLNEIKEVLKGMDLELGMDITNWPPENVEELARRLDEPF